MPHFRDILHQERALSLLQRAQRSGRLHHAFLFDGPAGVGKELAARALAARLLCDAQRDPDADACGSCPACRALDAATHPDFHLIDRSLHKQHPDRAIRAGKGLFLSVALIRHFLIEPSASSPTLGRRRVFVIRDAERMNEEAQNALLKTLEEPPGRATLILLTDAADRLLPTIRSRCQLIPFVRLPDEFVAARLAKSAAASSADCARLAALCDGRLGVALRWHRAGVLSSLEVVADLLVDDIAQSPEAFAKRLVECAESVGAGLSAEDRPDRPPAETADDASETDADDDDNEPRAAGKLATDVLRDALKLVFSLAAAVMRDAIFVHAGAAPRLPGLRQPERLAARLAEHRLSAGVQACAAAERMLDRNVAAPLVCERLALELGEPTTSILSALNA